MKVKQKLIAILMTTILMSSNLLSLGSQVIASIDELEKQNSKTNHTNVEFNSYFEGNTHQKAFSINEGGKMYIELKVKENGYLKNGIVEFSNGNYTINSNQINSEYIQKVEGQSIYLKQIQYNQEIVAEIPIYLEKQQEIDKDLFSRESQVIFKGTYVDGNGKEKTIEKTITNQVKWEEEAQIELTGKITKYLPYQIGEDYGVLVQAKIDSGIKDNILPISKTQIEIEVPTIQNIKPEKISVIANNTKATNGLEEGTNFGESNYNYDVENGKITIQVQNNANSEDKIAWGEGKDEYIITYIYKGQEIYEQVKEQLAKAEETKLTEEEKQAGEKNENAIEGELKVKANIAVYQAEEKTLEMEGTLPYTIEEAKGDITDYNITSEGNISKGYIYANYAKIEKEKAGEEVEEKIETIYELNYYASIYDKNLSKEITFEVNAEKLVAEAEYEIGKNVITKQVKIAENVFGKILGQEGQIEVSTKEGTLLGKIDATSTKDEQGNYVLDISEARINEIKIKTSLPVIEGVLEMQVEKAFVTEQSYTQSQMKAFERLVVEMTGKDAINSKTTSKEIELQEPVSKAQISIEEGEGSLSTIGINKGVEIRVVLDTSSVQNALYKNPVIEIQMPSQIEKLEIKDINLLLEDELKIKESKVISQNGKQIIQISLKGTQTQYENKESNGNNVITKGANIIITADITLNPLTPSETAEVRMYYTNQNTNLYEESYQKQNTMQRSMLRTTSNTGETVGTTVATVNLVAPTGVVAAHGMSGYHTDGSEILSIEGEKQEGKLETYGEKKAVTIQGTVTNNYSNSIENVYILGRLPFEGNKEIDTTTDLGSNLTMAMTQKITTTGIDSGKIKIYYSANGEASKDLTNTANGWTETPENLSEIKSYLIAITGEIEATTQLNFEYQVELPEGLSYNNSSYTTYKVYYDNKSEEATIGETKTAGIIGVTTGKGPELEVKLTSSIEGEEGEDLYVRDGQYVRFFVEVTNKGTLQAENVNITIDGNRGTEKLELEDGTIVDFDLAEFYIVDYNESTRTYRDVEGNKKTINLGNINVNETKKAEYEVRINTLYEGVTTITNQVTVSADNMEKDVKSNECILKGLNSVLNIVNIVNKKEGVSYLPGTEIEYDISVKNITVSNLSNITVTIPLPNDVTVTSASMQGEEEGAVILKTQVEFIIDNLAINETKTIEVKFKIGEQTEEKFSTWVKATTNDKIHYSNERYISVGYVDMEGEQLQLKNNYIKENEKFYYEFNITTKGTNNITNFVLEDTLPNEVSYYQRYTENETGINVSVVGDETKKPTYYVVNDNNKIQVKIPFIEPNTTFSIRIYVTAYLQEQIEEKQVTNKAIIYADRIEQIELNTITHYIEYVSQLHEEDTPNQDNSNQNNNGTYKITGQAWLDSNKNGQKEEGEDLLSGIQVMLIYKNNSQIVRGQDGKDKITTTNSNGNYEFTGLTNNQYLVIFLYDSGKYSITQYQKQGIGESYNSDAISMKIILDGEQKYAGVTDTIKLSNGNKRDVDIGLYEEAKFDLKLDKYISKITLTTPTIGTKVYEYNKSQLEKIEVLSQNVNKSSIVVEYKIVITNEGQTSGYAKKIIDYLPEDTKFNSEINSNWYVSDNNNTIYNASLANTIINPGESKEISLILSFNITDKNIGTIINNNAEIYESYNTLGLVDIDSVEANMLSSEDDMSKADIVLSIVTGKIILYTILTLAILAILTISIIIIKNKVLNKKI